MFGVAGGEQVRRWHGRSSTLFSVRSLVYGSRGEAGWGEQRPEGACGGCCCGLGEEGMRGSGRFVGEGELSLGHPGGGVREWWRKGGLNVTDV